MDYQNEKAGIIIVKILKGLLIGVPVAVGGVLFTLLVEYFTNQPPGIAAVYGWGAYLSCVVAVCASVIVGSVQKKDTPKDPW